MKRLANEFGVAICGLVTSIIVAILNVTIAKMFDIDIFTFSIWFVIPAGAIGVGFAAASGYYFGSLYFHKLPTHTLLWQMVVIAGFTQLLIYYLGYSTFVFENGQRVKDLIPFTEYLDTIISKAHYRIGRAANIDTGEVGQMGYELTLI